MVLLLNDFNIFHIYIILYNQINAQTLFTPVTSRGDVTGTITSTEGCDGSFGGMKYCFGPGTGYDEYAITYVKSMIGL